MSPAMVDALRQLPGLHGVRDRLPVGRAVRQADRGHARRRSSAAGRARASERLRRARDLRAVPPPRAAARARAASRRLRAADGALPRALAAPARAGRSSRRPSRVARDAARAAPPAQGDASAGRVGFLQGCVQRVFFGDVNAATVGVLAAEGFEVHAPRQPRCCGALQLHAGATRRATLARETIAAFEGCDDDRRQRRRLRLGDEGLRPPARATTPSGASARRRSRPRCATSTSCWPSTSRRRARHPIAAARRLPRRLPPRPRPGRPRPAARRCCAAIPGLELRRARRVGAVLRLGRHLQPAQARAGGRARPAQGRATCSPPARRPSPPPTPAARCRSPRPRRTLPVYHPMELLARLDPWEEAMTVDVARPRPAAAESPHRRRAGLRRRAARALRAAPRASCSTPAPSGARGRRRRDARLPGRDREIREGDWQVAPPPPDLAGPARRDHRPDRPQDGHQRAELGRARASWPTSRTRSRRPGATWSRAR